MTPVWEMRRIAANNWKAGENITNHVHFNTHHRVYQHFDKHGSFRQCEPAFVEMTEAQFELWLMRTRAIRESVRKLIE